MGSHNNHNSAEMKFDWQISYPLQMMKVMVVFKCQNVITKFVNLKSNSALLYNKGHNLLTSTTNGEWT